ncbi:hypothetical protein ACF5W4_11055 [Bacillota bacterium Lsc_1132]
MAITTEGHTKMKDWLQALIKEGRYTIAGVAKTTPIFKVERNGDVITFYLYLDNNISGTVTKFELIDKDGTVFDDQPDNIVKPSLNGLLATFKYTVRRV